MPDNPPPFWTQWKETRLEEVHHLSRKKLRSYYDYFAEQHYGFHEEHQWRLLRAALERMESIQRELDRRSKFWATVAGFLAVIATGSGTAVAITECHARKRSPVQEHCNAGHAPINRELSPIQSTTPLVPNQTNHDRESTPPPASPSQP